MSWAKKIDRYTNEELFDLVWTESPNLATVHALRLLSERLDENNSEEFSRLVDLVAECCKFKYIFGGMPMGYSAAAELYKKGKTSRECLFRAIDTLSDAEIESLLEWLSPLEKQIR